MRALDIMTSPVVTVTRDVPIRVAAALMVSHGFTALPVVDADRRLVGIVTESDMLRGRYTDDDSGDTPVSEVLTTPVYGMDPAAPVDVLARVMIDDRIRCVPVVDGGRLVGVVTRRDLVRALARTDASVAADVRERLDAYDPGGRWSVAVHDGHVDLGAPFPDERAARIAVALTEAVTGVVGVRVHAAADMERTS
ncbi:HPP family protein [Actinosynnema sp. NPDC059335]|uniref:CBS domain-containing protein n=1 Tax=Actinosynnema sp. NPDC059335 TaxID=3346804 RepID=UPI00366C7614